MKTARQLRQELAKAQSTILTLRDALRPFAEAWEEVQRDDEPRSRVPNTWFFDDKTIAKALKVWQETRGGKNAPTT